MFNLLNYFVMKWNWLFLLFPVVLIVLVVTDVPVVGSYQKVELQYDEGANRYFAVVGGQEVDVLAFDRADTTKMQAGMPVYCLQASRDSWIKIWEYYFSPTEVDPEKWVKDIYPEAGAGKGPSIFICVLTFLIILMLLCFQPKKMVVIYADSD